jgi:hypothetical protein
MAGAVHRYPVDVIVASLPIVMAAATIQATAMCNGFEWKEQKPRDWD